MKLKIKYILLIIIVLIIIILLPILYNVNKEYDLGTDNRFVRNYIQNIEYTKKLKVIKITSDQIYLENGEVYSRNDKCDNSCIKVLDVFRNRGLEYIYTTEKAKFNPLLNIK